MQELARLPRHLAGWSWEKQGREQWPRDPGPPAYEIALLFEFDLNQLKGPTEIFGVVLEGIQV